MEYNTVYELSNDMKAVLLDGTSILAIAEMLEEVDADMGVDFGGSISAFHKVGENEIKKDFVAEDVIVLKNGKFQKKTKSWLKKELNKD